jgi:branched-chain amino acid transport system permease protein
MERFYDVSPTARQTFPAVTRPDAELFRASPLRTVLSHAVPPVVLVLIGLIASTDRYLLFLATSAAIAYVLTASYNLIVGYAGIFSLGHVAVYGIGAYLSIYAENNWGFNFWTALLLVFVAGGVIGLLISWPTAHLKGIYIAVATLGFAVAISEVINAWKPVTGGAGGMIDIQIPDFFGIRLIGGSIGYYIACAAVAWIVVEVAIRVDRSGLGRRLVALRENPRSLAAVGVRPASVRMLAFVVGSAFAAVAGSLFAHFQLAISPDSFDMVRLVGLLLATLIGGLGKFFGPVIGVVALIIIDEIGFNLGDAQPLLYGIAILVLLSVNSTGVAGLLEAVVRRFLPRRRPPVQRPVSEPEPVGGTATHGDELLVVGDVVVRFGGVTAVNEASFSVHAGEVVGLIGPNGAGKTTLFNAVTGDVPLVSGTVTIDSRDITAKKPFQVVSAGVARTFQSPSLVRDMTVLENVMLGGEGETRATAIGQLLHSPAAVRDDREQAARAMELLQRLGIAVHAHESVGSLPYGILRLTEIARNLMLDPRVLLLDEPGAGLTDDDREHLATVLRSIAAAGAGVVLVDHNMSLITAACERLIVVDHGVVLAEGPTREVLAHPDVVTAYLGEVAG